MWGILFFKASAACWHAGGGRGGRGSGGGGRRGGPGAAPVESRGEAPAGGSGDGAPRLSRNELKMFHEQIVSRNEATR